jgi:hypothetical protein
MDTSISKETPSSRTFVKVAALASAIALALIWSGLASAAPCCGSCEINFFRCVGYCDDQCGSDPACLNPCRDTCESQLFSCERTCVFCGGDPVECCYYRMLPDPYHCPEYCTCCE